MDTARPRHDPALDVSTAAFVAAFEDGWAQGGGADRFYDHFVPEWVDPEVTLVQPLGAPRHGYDGFRRFCDWVFTLAPDLTLTVTAVEPIDEGVILDLAFRGTIGGRTVTWSGRDTITLRDGRLLRRQAELELGPILRASMRNPRSAATLARASVPSTGDGAIAGGGLVALAVGRLVLGAAGRLAPGATARAFGMAGSSPELDYVTRVFGIRAIALGLGYLSTDGPARRRWQRLAFLCDISDTIAGVGDLVRGQVPRSTALRATALTGAYAAVGAAAIARDRAEQRTARRSP